MSHQGEILQEAIKNSGISVTRIVDELGITRPTIYRKFKDDTLDVHFVNAIGKIIGHDFSNDFTLAQQSVSQNVTPLSRPNAAPALQNRLVPVPAADNDLNKQLLALQTKYIALLEAYNELVLKVYGPK